jgi:hypothetical protein
MSGSIGVDRSGGRTVENRPAEVEQRLTAALAGWQGDQDVRVLRRHLLELLRKLDD